MANGFGQGVVLVFATVLAARAAAQDRIFVAGGDAAGDQLGWSVADAGDVNGDGTHDVIAGAPQSLTAKRGYANVYSGVDGSVLGHFAGNALGDGFGASVSGAGDVDSDGFDDVIVGTDPAAPSPNPSGYAKVFSGASGALLHTFHGVAVGDRYGFAVGAAGDLDHDGFGDVLVGAPQDISGTGYVEIRSGANGALLRTFLGPVSGARAGWSVARLGDLDVDGFDDYAIGMPGDPLGFGSVAGRAHVVSGATGAVLLSKTTASLFDGFGWSVAPAGDVDGDSLPDLAVGAPFEIARGAVHVYSGANGAQLTTRQGFAVGDRFGWSVARSALVDADLVLDIAIGVTGEDNLGFDSGQVKIVRATDSATVGTCEGDAGSDAAGSSVALVADLNGDGRAEVAYGSPGNDASAPDAGRVVVVSLICVWTGDYCAHNANSAATDGAYMTFVGSLSIADNDFTLATYKAPAGQSGTFFYGANSIQIPFGDGFRCIAAPLQRVRFVPIDSDGVATASIDFTAPPSPIGALASGTTWSFQFHFRDPTGPGGSGFNLSNATRITFCP
jgi:hypothetical protein